MGVDLLSPANNERRGPFLKWLVIGGLFCLLWGSLLVLGVVYHVEYKNLCSTEDDVFGIFGICFLAYLFARSSMSEVLMFLAEYMRRKKTIVVCPIRMNDVFDTSTRVRLINAQIMACTSDDRVEENSTASAPPSSSSPSIEEGRTDSIRRALVLLNTRVQNISKELERPRPSSGTSVQKLLITTDVVPMFSLIFLVALGIEATDEFGLSCGYRSRIYNWTVTSIVLLYLVLVGVPMLIQHVRHLKFRQDGCSCDQVPEVSMSAIQIDNQEEPPQG